MRAAAVAPAVCQCWRRCAEERADQDRVGRRYPAIRTGRNLRKTRSPRAVMREHTALVTTPRSSQPGRYALSRTPWALVDTTAMAAPLQTINRFTDAPG